MNTEAKDNKQNTETSAEVTTVKEPVVAENSEAPKVKVVEPKFKVISIDKTEAPSGMTGNNWYRYIIGQGSSKIEGLTMGNLKEVTEHAELMAIDLNGRSRGGNSAHKTNKSKVTPPNPPKPPAPAVNN